MEGLGILAVVAVILALVGGIGLVANVATKDNKGIGKTGTKKVGAAIGLGVIVFSAFAIMPALNYAGVDPGSFLPGNTGGGGNNPGDYNPPQGPFTPYNYHIEVANQYAVTFVIYKDRMIIANVAINYTADSITPGYIEPVWTFSRIDHYHSEDDNSILGAKIWKFGEFSDSSGVTHNIVSKNQDMRYLSYWETSAGATKCQGLDKCAYGVDAGDSATAYTNITLTVAGADANSFVAYRYVKVADILLEDPGGFMEPWEIWINPTTVTA